MVVEDDNGDDTDGDDRRKFRSLTSDNMQR